MRQPAWIFDESLLADGHFELLNQIVPKFESLNSRLRTYYLAVAQILSVTQTVSKAPDLPVNVKLLEDLKNTLLKKENKFVLALPKIVEDLL